MADLPAAPPYDIEMRADFAGGGEGQLTLRAGEQLRVTRDENGWLLGQKEDGKSGWLPKSYAAIPSRSPVAPASPGPGDPPALRSKNGPWSLCCPRSCNCENRNQSMDIGHHKSHFRRLSRFRGCPRSCRES